MKNCARLLLLLSLIIPNLLQGQSDQKLIRVPFYKALDAEKTHTKRFYPESNPPSLIGIPEDLDTFLIFYSAFSSKQLSYESYRDSLSSEEVFQKMNITSLEVADHPIKNKLYALSGLKGDKKIVIVDTNNNGNLLDETVMEFKAEFSKEETYRLDNWSPFLLIHFEKYRDNKISNIALIGKIKPYLTLIPSPPSKLEETLALSFKGFEYQQGLFTLDGDTYSIRKNLLYNSFDFKLLEKEASIVIPTLNLGQSITLGNSRIFLDTYDYERDELLLVKINESELAKNEYGGLVGLKAPNIQGQNLLGQDFDLQKHLGKYVILEFWGTWCGPCKGDHPALKKLDQKIAGKKIDLIGIALDYKKEKLKSYVAQENLEWEQIFFNMRSEEGKKIYSDYYVSGYPTYFLISPEGEILIRGKLNEIEQGVASILEKD